MNLKTVLFDLDGTLLPMDNDGFTKEYFRLLAGKMSVCGYEADALIRAVWAGTEDMIRNNGECTNETVFWRRFEQIYGTERLRDRALFDEFYRTDFLKAQSRCGMNPLAAETVRAVKKKGLRTILATNPIFPRNAVESRIRWAGLEPEDFEWITTYENSFFCKPDPRYYLKIAETAGTDPSECLMIGNDVSDDGAAEKAGMAVFILTDCLISRGSGGLSGYPHGGFEELNKYIERQTERKGITV